MESCDQLAYFDVCREYLKYHPECSENECYVDTTCDVDENGEENDKITIRIFPRKTKNFSTDYISNKDDLKTVKSIPSQNSDGKASCTSCAEDVLSAKSEYLEIPDEQSNDKIMEPTIPAKQYQDKSVSTIQSEHEREAKVEPKPERKICRRTERQVQTTFESGVKGKRNKLKALPSKCSVMCECHSQGDIKQPYKNPIFPYQHLLEEAVRNNTAMTRKSVNGFSTDVLKQRECAERRPQNEDDLTQSDAARSIPYLGYQLDEFKMRLSVQDRVMGMVIDKDKDEDKDKDKEKAKDKDKEKNKEKIKMKEEVKDKDKSKSKEKGKDKGKDKEKNKEKDKEKGKETDKEKEKETDKETDNEKDREKDNSKDEIKANDKDKYKDPLTPRLFKDAVVEAIIIGEPVNVIKEKAGFMQRLKSLVPSVKTNEIANLFLRVPPVFSHGNDASKRANQQIRPRLKHKKSRKMENNGKEKSKIEQLFGK